MSLYIAVTGNQLSETQFRRSIIHNLITQIEVQSPEKKHIDINAKRRKCYICYKEMAEQEGKQQAQKVIRRIQMKCTKCLKHFCLKCSFKTHSRKLL